MSEQSKENLDDSEFRSRQRRTVGIVKVRVSDQLPAQHAAGRDIAFNDIHAEHLGEGNLENRSAQRNGRMNSPFLTQFRNARPLASLTRQRLTLTRAQWGACALSDEAPEVTYLRGKPSPLAALPAIRMARREGICSSAIDSLPGSGNGVTMPSARTRGMIVALW